MVASSWQAVQTGQYQHLAVTGKTIKNYGIAIYELKDGRIISTNVLTDRLGFLQQMGAVPADINQLSNTPSTNHLFFIDKFVIPVNARDEFIKRLNYNRDFIKHLPGFIRDNAYESTDASGNTLFTTVAVWENAEAMDKAKAAVQTEYKRIGFDPTEMTKRLSISMDRAIYKEVQE
jgi:hypothetical protein